MSKNYELICQAAFELGKNKQDIANWTFAGKVPKSHRYDVYLLVKNKGTELSIDDFDDFKK